MDRQGLEKYIAQTYGTDADYPWRKYPDSAVFRHSNNKKWFALMMDVSKKKLGLADAGMLTVVNLKCSPILIGSLLSKTGFFPAYHMSKDSWISVALDGSASDEELKMLLDMSFEATAGKTRNRRTR